MRLFADDAVTANFLFVPSGIRDYPVTGDQLRSQGSGIFDRDRIGEHIAVVVRGGLFLNVDRLDRNTDLIVSATRLPDNPPTTLSL